MKRVGQVIHCHLKAVAALLAVASAGLLPRCDAQTREAARLAPVITHAVESAGFGSVITDGLVNSVLFVLPFVLEQSLTGEFNLSRSQDSTFKISMVRMDQSAIPPHGSFRIFEDQREALNTLVANRYFNYSSSQSDQPNVPLHAKMNLDTAAENFAHRAAENFPRETLENNKQLTEEQYEILTVKLKSLASEGQTGESGENGMTVWTGSFDLDNGLAKIEFQYGNFKLDGDLLILVAAIDGKANGVEQSPTCIVRKWLPENKKKFYPSIENECINDTDDTK